MRKLIALAVSLPLLAGCATAARSVMITQDIAVISVIGSTQGGTERVISDILAESGKFTLAHGYRYFIILKADDASRSATMSFSDVIIRRGSVTNNVTNPGPSYLTPRRNATYIRPGLDITIRMFREGEIDPRIQGVWNTDGAMAAPSEMPPPPTAKRRGPSTLRG